MEGPYTRIEYAPGRHADLYLIRFDKNGELLSRKTFAQFLAGGNQYTDVFLFSHGWNNIFSVALQRYTDFIKNYIEQRKRLGLPLPEPYRPALLGVIWPSTSFVLPWESGPEIAASPDAADGREQEEMLDFVLDSFDDEQSAAFAEYVDRGTPLGEADARAMATIVRDALVPENDPDTGTRPTVDEMLAAWQAIDQLGGAPVDYGDLGDFGTIGQPAGGDAGEPLAAGGIDLDPRNLLRSATVWKMKGRAGVVGAHGVGPVLRQILSGSPARVHMIGHSFGARVVLSAIASAAVPRKVHSVLLLQPAINRWCFAPSVKPLATDTQPGPAGGYHVTLDRVEKPIFTTYSDADKPLHDIFHFVVRSNTGEVNIAAFEDDFHRYGALGGWGPEGLGADLQRVTACQPGASDYRTDPGCQVLAIDGSAQGGAAPLINGHGDVVTPVTAWMLHCAAQEEA